jgi:glycosyltransferase involved in cell wall biosynthesis
MRNDDHPLVSIGLPVRNGGEYLDASVKSLLAQTYPNIELIICDNVSNDGTEEYCRALDRADERVRFYRNETNVGGAGNHNLTFSKARGKYFRWAAHDDIAEPELIERCVEVLEHEPDVVVCHTDFVHIDEHGSITERISRNHGSSSNASERFRAVVLAEDYCEETYGLIRSDVLRSTQMLRDYTNSDRTLMSELALRGRFHNVEQCLFRKRLHPGNVYTDWRTRMAWFDERYQGRMVLPWWIALADYLRLVRRVPLSSADRRRCRLTMAAWMLRNGKKLAKDVLVAAMMTVQSRERRMARYESTRNWA